MNKQEVLEFVEKYEEFAKRAQEIITLKLELEGESVRSIESVSIDAGEIYAEVDVSAGCSCCSSTRSVYVPIDYLWEGDVVAKMKKEREDKLRRAQEEKERKEEEHGQKDGY